MPNQGAANAGRGEAKFTGPCTITANVGGGGVGGHSRDSEQHPIDKFKRWRVVKSGEIGEKAMTKVVYAFKRAQETDRVIRYVNIVAGFMRKEAKDLIEVLLVKEKQRYITIDDIRVRRDVEEVTYEFGSKLFAPWYEAMESVKIFCSASALASFNKKFREEVEALPIPEEEVEDHIFQNERLFKELIRNEAFLLYLGKLTYYNMSASSRMPRYETGNMMNRADKELDAIITGLWRSMEALKVLRPDLIAYLRHKGM